MERGVYCVRSFAGWVPVARCGGFADWVGVDGDGRAGVGGCEEEEGAAAVAESVQRGAGWGTSMFDSVGEKGCEGQWMHLARRGFFHSSLLLPQRCRQNNDK